MDHTKEQLLEEYVQVSLELIRLTTREKELKIVLVGPEILPPSMPSKVRSNRQRTTQADILAFIRKNNGSVSPKMVSKHFGMVNPYATLIELVKKKHLYKTDAGFYNLIVTQSSDPQ